MRAEILNNWTAQIERYVRPAHARALRPVELILLPMIDSGEI